MAFGKNAWPPVASAIWRSVICSCMRAEPVFSTRPIAYTVTCDAFSSVIVSPSDSVDRESAPSVYITSTLRPSWSSAPSR